MNPMLMSLAVWATNLFKGLTQDPACSHNADRLRMSLLYIKSIKTFRLLFISFLGVGACLVFLLAGLILLDVTLFMYAPLDAQTKMYIGLASTFTYFLIAGLLFHYIFLQETWMSMFNAKEMMKEIEGIK